MTVREGLLAPFERWSPPAFVVGGLGILGTTVAGSLDVAGVAQPPPWSIMGPLLFGLWFVFAGLIGFYPRIAESAPRLALGGVWTSAVGWTAWTLTLLAAVGVDLTSERTFVEPGSWAPPLLAGAFVLVLLSFLVYGVASTRSERRSRPLGLLLLVPVAAFFGQAALLVTKIVQGDVNGVVQLVLGAVIGLALLAVGRLLGSDSEWTAGAETRPDARA